MRMTGRTTRLIDQAIQELFEGRRLLFPMHKDKINSDRIGALNISDYEFEEKENFKVILDPDWREGGAQENIFRRFIYRLQFEHNLFCRKRHEHYYGFYISLEDFKKGRAKSFEEDYKTLNN